MSAMDEFVRLTKIRKTLTQYSWHAAIPKLRFWSEHGRESQEHYLSVDEIAEIEKALRHVEYAGASMARNPYVEIGDACKREVMRFLDKQIAEAATQARSEAEACLAAMSPKKAE